MLKSGVTGSETIYDTREEKKTLWLKTLAYELQV